MQTIGHSIHRWSGQFSDAVDLFRRLFSAFIHTFKNLRFWMHITGKARRLLLVHFRKDYVQSQLLARRGHCRQCGTCCNLLFTCPALTKSGNCAVYGICRPQACKVFPIDQRDIDEIKVCGNHCGFHFNDVAADTAVPERRV